MKKITTIIIFFQLFISCKEKNDTIDISLETSNNNNIKFNPILGEFYATSLMERFPEYHDEQKKQLSKKTDSTIVTTFYLDYKQFMVELYDKKLIGKEKIIKNKVDTLFEREKKQKNQLLILSEFKDGNQKIYLKFDKDGDYKYYHSFSKDFQSMSDPSEIIEELPLVDFTYATYENKKKHSFTKKIKVYPSLVNTNYIKSENELVQKARMTILFSDYKSGGFYYKNEKFNVAIQGVNGFYASILIKHDTLQFSRKNYPFNTNFTYKLKDTINLNNDLFVVDSLDVAISKLMLKKVEKNNKNHYGHRIGETIKDYDFIDLLDDEKNKLSDFEDKKYSILYFWGTWCKPCVRSLPQLKMIESKYKSQANLLGVILDKDSLQVKEFIKNNGIKWKNHFSDRRNRGGIIREMRITEYPTIVLLDKKRKILYRGAEKEDLLKLLKKE